MTPQKISASPLKLKTVSQQQFKCVRLGPILCFLLFISQYLSQRNFCYTGIQPNRFLIETIELGPHWNEFSHPQQTYRSVGLLPQLWSHGKKGLGLCQEDNNSGGFQIGSQLPSTHSDFGDSVNNCFIFFKPS